MDRPNPIEELLAAASAHVFSDGELRTLAMMAISQATQAIDRRHYGTAAASMKEALEHLRALREKGAQ